MDSEKNRDIKTRNLGNSSDYTLNELENIVKRDLPGWRITEESLDNMGFKRTEALEELKSAVKESLPNWHLSPYFIEKNINLKEIKSPMSISIRMNNSSIEKTADYSNGLVTIIQG